MRISILILSALLLTAMPMMAADEFDLSQGAVLAIVGDKVLTSLDMVQRLQNMKLNPALNDEERDAARKQTVSAMLDDIIDFELIYMDYVERKGRIPAAYLQSRIDRIVVARANGDEEKFRDMLHDANMTYKEFVDEITKRTAVEMMIYERTRKYISVTDEQVREYFYAHGNDFMSPDRFRLQVIMLKKDGRYAGKIPSVAGEIMSKYHDGADFGTLAREYSEGMNAEEGGDLGWRDDLAPALMEVAAKLAPGEMYSGMLNIGNATYLVRLWEKQDGRKPELNVATEMEIREVIQNQIAHEKYKEYIRKLYLKFPVRRLDGGYGEKSVK